MRNTNLSLFIVFLLFVSSYSFSQILPINLHWSGKTDSAILIANKIIKNKSLRSKIEVLNAYDFLAEYNLELGHFKSNLSYLIKYFELNKNTSIDSALFYARVANYTLCYMLHDSTQFYCTKAISAFKNVVKKNEDSIKIARYYSYFGNAARNTKYINSAIIDTAIAYSNNSYLKALHYRRYATFITDTLNIESKAAWQSKALLDRYKKCIYCITTAEKFATKIYPNKKSYLHATIYKIWSLAERYKGNEAQSVMQIKRAKEALEDTKKISHYAEYSSICSWEASSNLNLFYKTHDIKFIYETEKTLLISIPAWEKYLENEKLSGIKSFDDQYSINPYQKLVVVYYELYKAKKDNIYLAKCYSFIEFIKNNRTLKDERYSFSPSYSKQNLDTISKMCIKKNGAVINYFITSHPYMLLAIVTLPDTTFLIECSSNKNRNIVSHFYKYDLFNALLFKNDSEKSKKIGYSIYDLYFMKIDSILKKRKINDVVIIPTENSYMLNFDLLQTDTVPVKSIFQSALINRYKFTYITSADVLINVSKTIKTYNTINLLVPMYNSKIYSTLYSSKKLIDELSKNFNFIKIEKDNITVFFEKNKLIQFIGHTKANTYSKDQKIILSDTNNINSSAILKNDLTGSSYLINGCNSNLGKQEQYSTTNSLPYQLMKQHANSVTSTLWNLDDKENAEFLEKFYGLMAEGLASSDALYQTKLYFAKQNYSPSMWGAYVYYGSDFYLTKKNMLNNYWYLVIIIALSVLLIIKLYKNRKSK
jgi:CHAT domain-containing protein